MTKSLSESVRERINKYPYIKYALADGLVNYSALARKFSPEISAELNKKINGESLIVAIKRYADEIDKREKPKDIMELISKSTLSMQSDISYAMIERTSEALESVEGLLGETEWDLGEVRMVVQGANKIFLLLRSERLESFLEKLNVNAFEHNKEKAMVTIKLPKEAYSSYGVFVEMAQLLARKGISIELVSVPPELHFIIDERDCEITYKTLREFVKGRVH